MKLVAIGGCMGAPTYFKEMFTEHQIIQMYGDGIEEAISKITNNCVVMLGGGEDISPAIYTDKPSAHNYGSLQPSRRDEIEMLAFRKAVEVGAKIYGICRGAQLACVLSGGKLYQDVTGHAGRDHLITTKDGHEYFSSSAHHQMMMPTNVKHELIAWTTEARSKYYIIDDDNILEDIGHEPEIVYFPETRALGVQGHPEFMPRTSPFVIYNQQLIKEYLFK